jgi:death on curing protein
VSYRIAIPISLVKPPWYHATYDGLTVADFLLIAEAVLGVDANRLARATDLGAAESALAAPFAGFGDVEFYPDPAVKAGILCSRILRNHPLIDGNKRVAYLAMREFLARNSHQWIRPDEDDAVEMIERLAAGEISEEDFAAWVAEHLV